MIYAEIIIGAAGIYLLIGAFFAVWFAARGAGRLDESAKSASLAFRLIIFFGALAFWVLLARRLLKGESKREKTAHRLAADK